MTKIEVKNWDYYEDCERQRNEWERYHEGIRRKTKLNLTVFFILMVIIIIAIILWL